MAEKNIEMNVMNESGGYDVLYPKTKVENIVNITGNYYNKEETLTSDTKDLLSLEADGTPDDAFRNIAIKMNMIMNDVGYVYLTVKTNNGNPLVDIPVNGFVSLTGEPTVIRTNNNGEASGYVLEGQQPLSTNSYADLDAGSIQVNITKGEFYYEDLVLTTHNYLSITSSRTLQFSKNVLKVNVSVGGGGGGGHSSGYFNSGGNNAGARGAGGGGGGYSVVQENVSFSAETNYQAVVGAGGAISQNRDVAAGTGGQSSFLGVVANGGNGGTGAGYNYVGTGGIGNGNGGNGGYTGWDGGTSAGAPGGNGTTYYYSAFEVLSLYGGGGGGGGVGFFMANNNLYSSGGNPNGADGCTPGWDINAPNPKGVGGGGGGGPLPTTRYETESKVGTSSAGYRGHVGICMYLINN